MIDPRCFSHQLLAYCYWSGRSTRPAVPLPACPPAPATEMCKRSAAEVAYLIARQESTSLWVPRYCQPATDSVPLLLTQR